MADERKDQGNRSDVKQCLAQLKKVKKDMRTVLEMLRALTLAQADAHDTRAEMQEALERLLRKQRGLVGDLKVALVEAWKERLVDHGPYLRTGTTALRELAMYLPEARRATVLEEWLRNSRAAVSFVSRKSSAVISQVARVIEARLAQELSLPSPPAPTPAYSRPRVDWVREHRHVLSENLTTEYPTPNPGTVESFAAMVDNCFITTAEIATARSVWPEAAATRMWPYAHVVIVRLRLLAVDRTAVRTKTQEANFFDALVAKYNSLDSIQEMRAVQEDDRVTDDNVSEDDDASNEEDSDSDGGDDDDDSDAATEAERASNDDASYHDQSSCADSSDSDNDMVNTAAAVVGGRTRSRSATINIGAGAGAGAGSGRGALARAGAGRSRATRRTRDAQSAAAGKGSSRSVRSRRA